MPKMDFQDLEGAIAASQQVTTFADFAEILPDLTASQQSLLYQALGGDLFFLMSAPYQFTAIEQLVKHPAELRLHLLTHISSSRHLQLLLSFPKMRDHLFLLGLTHPERVADVRLDIIRAIRNFAQLKYYWDALGNDQKLFIRFLGDSILLLGSRKQLQETGEETFICNSYTYAEEQQDTWSNRCRRQIAYIGSFFTEPTLVTTLQDPFLLEDFYKQHSEIVMSHIETIMTDYEQSQQLRINKIAALILCRDSLLGTLKVLSASEGKDLIRALGKKFLEAHSFAYSHHEIYARLNLSSLEFYALIIELIIDKHSLIAAVNNHYLVSKVRYEANPKLSQRFSECFNALIQNESDLQQVKCKITMGLAEDFEKYFAAEIESLKETASLLRFK